MDRTSLPPESGSNQEGFYQVADEECDVHGEVSGRFTKSIGLLAEDGSDKCVNHNRRQSMDKTSLPPESGSNQKGFHDVADEECDIHGEVSGRSTKSKGWLAENGSDKCANHKRSQSMDKTSLPPESGSNHEGFHQVADEECDVHGEVSGRFTQSTGPLDENGSDKCVDYKKPQSSGFRFNQENLPLQYHGKHMKVDRPGKPVVKRVSSDSIDVEWEAVTSFCNGDVYQVRCENIGSRKWKCQNFEINSGKITSLQSDTSYIFSVRLVKSNGEISKFGETSKEVRTQLEVDRPGKPVVTRVSWDSVDIEWDAVTRFCNGDVYQVRCENTKSRTWKCQNFEINSGKIIGLEPGNSYIFKVRLVKSDGEEGKYCETSVEVKTQLEVDRPGKPVVKRVSWCSIDIEWNAVASFCNGDVYQVRYENTKSRKWNCQNFEINSGKIMGLEPGNSYIFKVRLVKSDGEEGKYGETSVEVKTQLEVDRPGKPVVKRVSKDSIDIEWDALARLCNGDVYQVRCENTKSRKWNCQYFEINSGKIMGLEPGNSYIFKVRLVKSDGEEGKYGETSVEVKTQLEQDLPGKPSIKDVSSDSVDIEWGAVGSLSICDVYQVRIENTKDKKWYCLNFETNSGKILDLTPSTSYTFKVRLVKENGEEGTYGETSEEVTTKEEPIPGKPSVKHVFADRVELIWERVDTFCKGDVYEVHVENIDKEEKICKKIYQNSATIEDLQPDSRYVFKVRLVKQNGKLSKFSDNSDMMTTCSTHASNLIRTQCPVDKTCIGTFLYKLPLDEVQHATNADAMSIKYEIGLRGRDQIIEKTIMLVGATGTGKSTFVESLANYVLGVRLKDPYRFTVMRKKDREKQKDKAISQTDWITSYAFNPQEGTRLPYILNVIDTPGFGDTRSPTYDEVLVDRIRRLFKAPGEKGVQTIDAICFFVKASDCRLTQAQSYILHEIQSLFGNDIKDNICLLITFADGSYPVVMHAVKTWGLQYGEKFEFNNFPRYSVQKESIASMFWKMSLNSYTALLRHLETLETKSLQLTKEVLKERHRLELTYQNLHTQINDTMSIMHNIDKEMKILHENIDEIDRNKKITYTETELKVIHVDLPPNERATNCLVCKKKESFVLQTIKRMFRVNNPFSGKCNQCTCNYKSHETTGYRSDTCEETEEKTYEDMQKRFQDATKKFLTVNELLKKMKDEKETNIAKTNKMLNEMLRCKNRLNEIALRPVQLSIHEHFEQFIEAERREGKPGFQNRIEQLKQFRKEARILEISKTTAI